MSTTLRTNLKPARPAATVRTVAVAELPEVPHDRWLTAKELAGKFALQEDSAYRWHDDGTIPSRFVKYCGTRRMLFHPDIVAHLESEFSSAH